MSKYKWYDISTQYTDGKPRLNIKLNSEGRYGKRKEIEPLLNRYHRETRENKKLLKTIKSEVEDVRNGFAKSGDDIGLCKCNCILNRLDSIMGIIDDRELS